MRHGAVKRRTLSPPPMSDDIESQSHRPMIPASSSRPARPTGAAHPRGRSSACAALSDCLFSCWLWLRGAAHSCCGCCCSKTIRLHASGRTLRSVRLLAEGGFSYVYLVEDVKSRVPYALKVMLCHTAEQAGRARWEAEVHQSFHHPNLLALEDVDFQPVDGGDKEHAYFLFDYMPRGSLQDALNRGHTFPESECLRLFVGICSGVRALHHHSPPWAHRDIKPQNVLMSRDDLPVLMDFGSTAEARVTVPSRFEALRLQEHAQAHCSMPYRAPELYDVPTGAVIDEKTDVWSLGCLLYALAFRYSPFEVEYSADDEPRVVECSHLRVIGRVPFPRSHRLSPAFVDLIKWMLAVDPAARPDIDQVMARLGSQDAGDLPSSYFVLVVYPLSRAQDTAEE